MAMPILRSAPADSTAPHSANRKKQPGQIRVCRIIQAVTKNIYPLVRTGIWFAGRKKISEISAGFISTIESR
jgi:hypothetical protein